MHGKQEASIIQNIRNWERLSTQASSISAYAIYAQFVKNIFSTAF